MTFWERITEKETKIGQFLKRELSVFLLVCSALGAANEYFVLIPSLSEYVPTWVKTSVALAGLVSFVSGKLTVKKDEPTDNKTP